MKTCQSGSGNKKDSEQNRGRNLREKNIDRWKGKRQAEREAERSRQKHVENLSSSSSTAAAGGGGDVPGDEPGGETGVDQVGNTVGADVKGHEVQGVRENRLRGPSTAVVLMLVLVPHLMMLPLKSNHFVLNLLQLEVVELCEIASGDDCPSVLPDIAEAMKNADQEWSGAS